MHGSVFNITGYHVRIVFSRFTHGTNTTPVYHRHCAMLLCSADACGNRFGLRSSASERRPFATASNVAHREDARELAVATVAHRRADGVRAPGRPPRRRGRARSGSCAWRHGRRCRGEMLSCRRRPSSFRRSAAGATGALPRRLHAWSVVVQPPLSAGVPKHAFNSRRTKQTAPLEPLHNSPVQPLPVRRQTSSASF